MVSPTILDGAEIASPMAPPTVTVMEGRHALVPDCQRGWRPDGLYDGAGSITARSPASSSNDCPRLAGAGGWTVSRRYMGGGGII